MTKKFLIGFWIIVIYICTILQVSGCYRNKVIACQKKAIDLDDQILKEGPDNSALDSLMHKSLILQIRADHYREMAEQWERLIFLNSK